MSTNKYKPHVLVIPEDDANRQLVNGFLLHYAVNDRYIQIMTPAGGWRSVLDVFKKEYIQYLNSYNMAHVIMIIDFDGDTNRREECEQQIPDNIRDRVFIIGSIDEPETIKQDLHESLEQIGWLLATGCSNETYSLWHTPHFEHNASELAKLIVTVRPIVFQG